MNNVLRQQLTKDSELFNIFFDLTVSEQKDISNIIEIIISKVQQMNQDVFVKKYYINEGFYSNISKEIMDKIICNILFDLDVKYTREENVSKSLFTYHITITYHITNLNRKYKITLSVWKADPYKSEYKYLFELKINYI